MVRVNESKRVYSGRISLRMDRFSLDGRIIEKEVVEHQNSVGIVPVIGNDIILVMQYRRAAGKELLEIPAGKMEKGETPKQAAVREMAEEISCTGKLKPLTKWYLAPGYSTELMHVFVSTGSTITEFAILENSLERFAKEAAKLGFDIIEVGENSFDLSMEQKRKITDTIKSTNLDFH